MTMLIDTPGNLPAYLTPRSTHLPAMEHARLLELVRQCVRETFRNQGAEQLDDTCETILIRDGFYCGRRFTCGQHRAIWFGEEKVIKFYGPQGEFVTAQSVEPLTTAILGAA